VALHGTDLRNPEWETPKGNTDQCITLVPPTHGIYTSGLISSELESFLPVISIEIQNNKMKFQVLKNVLPFMQVNNNN